MLQSENVTIFTSIMAPISAAFLNSIPVYHYICIFWINGMSRQNAVCSWEKVLVTPAASLVFAIVPTLSVLLRIRLAFLPVLLIKHPLQIIIDLQSSRQVPPDTPSVPFFLPDTALLFPFSLTIHEALHSPFHFVPSVHQNA